MDELYQRLQFANPGPCPTCKRAGPCATLVPCPARYPREGTFEAWLLTLTSIEYEWAAGGPIVVDSHGTALAPGGRRRLLQEAFAAGRHAASYSRVAEQPVGGPEVIEVCPEALAIGHIIQNHLPPGEVGPLLQRAREQLSAKGKLALAMFITAPPHRLVEAIARYFHVVFHELERSTTRAAADVLAELRALRGRCSCGAVTELSKLTQQRTCSMASAGNVPGGVCA